MRRMIICLFIILLPFAMSGQEESNEKPKTFFNDLIKTLSSDSTRDTTADTPPESEESAPLPVPEPKENVPAETKDDDQEETAIPAPEPPVVAEDEQSDEKTVSDTPGSPDTSDTAVMPEPEETKPEPVAGKPKKTKKERVKKEREPKTFDPYISEPDPRTRGQKKYVKQLEKAPRRKMRLITLDQADIIHSRKFRSVNAALSNPANLGTRAEFYNSFSIIPFNTLMLDVNTSTRPFVLLDEYFTTGELLTEAAEDSMIAMLGPNGLEVPVDIQFPTLINLKLSPFFGSLYANSGLYIREHSHIPADFFDIIFEGATFDNPYQMNEPLGVDLSAYLKNSLGYGAFVELPSPIGEVRFGGAVNAYAGAFTSLNVTNLELAPTSENTTMQGTMQILSPADTLSLFGEEGFQFHVVDDYIGIPRITLGFDLGFAWRFKLNRLLPFAPNILKNYFDVQVGVQDLMANIAMNHAYLREVHFEANAGDLISTFSDPDFSLDSITVIEENLIYADSTASEALGSKFNINLHYQPISQLMLKFGWSTYLTDGINTSAGPHMYYGLEVYPMNSLSLHASLLQRNTMNYWEAGFKLYSMKSEFGLKARIYDLNFSLTENFSGAGIMLNWARYF